MPCEPANAKNDEAIVSRRSEGNFNSTVDAEIVALGAGEGSGRVHHRADIGRYGGREASRDLAVHRHLSCPHNAMPKDGSYDLPRFFGPRLA
jgi:hypothetical protein